MKPNIVFLDEYTLGGADLGRLQALGEYKGYARTTPEELPDRCREADVIITNKVVLRRETLQSLPRLRLICVAATGTNNIDLEAAAELGIEVKNAAGYSTHSVAETTLGAAIALRRNIVYYDRYVKSGRLLRRRTAVPFRTAHPPALRLEMGHRRTRRHRPRGSTAGSGIRLRSVLHLDVGRRTRRALPRASAHRTAGPLRHRLDPRPAEQPHPRTDRRAGTVGHETLGPPHKRRPRRHRR